jgi:iron complex outermembrane receptor protein
MGTKIEYTTYADLQVQPSLRLLFQPSKRASCWAAVSRAARSPSRNETGFEFSRQVAPTPVFFQLFGNPDLTAESLTAYEVGYRAQPTDDFSWDFAAFYNDYRKLIGAQSLPPVFIPPNLFLISQYANNLDGDNYGCELTSNIQLTDRWRLYGAYTLLFSHVHGTDTFNAALQEGSAPVNQYYLQSSWDLYQNVQCDLIGRFIGPVRAVAVPSYAALDARISWRPRKYMEISIVGQNLTEGNHLEYRDPLAALQATEVPRTVYGMITYTY